MEFQPDKHAPALRVAAPTSRWSSFPRILIPLLAAWIAGFSTHLCVPYWRDHLVFEMNKGSSSLQTASQCRPPLPALLKEMPPCPEFPQLLEAGQSLNKFLSKRAASSDIDSLSIAVVTARGRIFEQGYGVLRANETSQANPVDRDSIYRLASISKMFTVLETLILRERGALNWDDPVEKFIPDFKYPEIGWAQYLHGEHDNKPGIRQPSVTLRQLSSHMSGIGRDYPPVQLKEWPGSFNNKTEGFPAHSVPNLLRTIAQYPLITPPYSYPVYSNSGVDLLGLVNVAANIKADLASGFSSPSPQTHKELIQRDIFDPLGMNASFFRTSAVPHLMKHMAIPAVDSEWADVLYDDVDDPAGGQYGSLQDLTTFMRTLLSGPGVVSENVVREWLRGLHAWSDDQHEVGAPWEIAKLGASRIYSKGGSLPGYHTQFSINPEMGYGVIVLIAGTFLNPAGLVDEAFARFQPALESVLHMQVLSMYGGVWLGDDSVAVVALIDGGLCLQTLKVRGQDIIALVRAAYPSARADNHIGLWSTRRSGEFRIAFEPLNPNGGCEPYWYRFDAFGNSNGAPIDLIYYRHGHLIYPSAGVTLTRD